MKFKISFTVLLFMLGMSVAQADKKLAVDKVKGALSVIALGTGGPVTAATGRASAGYLIMTDGQPRILMDVGGGVYARLAESGARLKDLDIVLLSHLHLDHTGDMSAVIKSVYFHNRQFNVPNGTFPPGRTKPVRVFGPDENGIPFPPILGADPTVPQYPDSAEYVHKHYDLNSGSDRYLNIFSRAISGGIFNVTGTNVSPNWQAYNPVEIINENGLVITAVGVNHGPVPALAFRVDYKGHSIVYTGDTSSKGGNLIELAQDVDMLIYDTAIMDNLPAGPNDAVFFSLHTTPTRMGQVAAQSGAKTLVLSHITPITDPRIDQVKDLVRAQGFAGKIKVAKDLKVYNLDDDDDDD